MSKSLRVAFIGGSHSGKNLACDYIIHKYTGRKIRFNDVSDNIVTTIERQLGQGGEELRSLIHNSLPKIYGTDVWQNLVEKEINRIDSISKTTNLLIPDLNDSRGHHMLKSKNFIIIRLHRYDVNNVLPEDFYTDYDIYNEGSKDDLFIKLEAICQNLL